MLARALLLVISALAAGAAHGWGALGHRVACDIAFRELHPGARDRVRALLGRDEPVQTLASACVWADAIRTDPRFDWAVPLHFVNVPREARSVSVRRDCARDGCALNGIYRFTRALGRTGAAHGEQLEALKFLGHLVADVHQPLHVAFADDRGGNRIRVSFFGRRTRLHFVWDTGIVSRLGANWRDIGRELHAAITPAERRRWLTGSPVQWANESLRLARSPALRYRAAPRCCLGLADAYLARHKSTVERRLQQSGVRFAALLNRIWP